MSEKASEDKKRKSRNPFKRFSRETEAVSERSIFEQAGIVLGVVIGVFFLLFVASLAAGIALGDTEGVANIIAIARDIFIMLLVMQGMIICIAMVVLIMQLASLVNLLENELTPIVKNIQEATSSLRGTGEFLSENVAAPVIETKAWIAGVGTFMKEVLALRHAVRRGNDQTSDKKVSASDSESAKLEKAETPKLAEKPTGKEEEKSEEKASE